MITRKLTDIGNMTIELTEPGKLNLKVTGCAGPAMAFLDKDDAIDLITVLIKELRIHTDDVLKELTR